MLCDGYHKCCVMGITKKEASVVPYFYCCLLRTENVVVLLTTQPSAYSITTRALWCLQLLLTDY